MSPDTENGWSEYRMLVVDWHREEVEARKEFREKLDAIALTLTEINTERKLGKWALGGGVAGFLSMLGTVVLFLFGIK